MSGLRLGRPGDRNRRSSIASSKFLFAGIRIGPTTLRMDNGPELTAQALVDWADERRIDLHYIQPGKPDQNAFIERFNRSYRTEVLNAHLFESLAEVRKLTEDWLVVYNQERHRCR